VFYNAGHMTASRSPLSALLRLLFPAALSLLAATGSAFCQAPADPGAAERLKDLFLDGRVEEAQAGALKHLQDHPEDVEARIVLANCYYKRATDLQAAEGEAAPSSRETPGALFKLSSDELREALRLAPDRKDIWLGLCKVERQANNVPSLLQCAADAAARFPGDDTFAVDLAQSAAPYVQRREFVTAESLLEAIARHNDGSFDILLSLGRTQYFAGKRDRGIATTDRALELRPDDNEALFQRGELAAYEGDFARAATYFQKVVDKAPASGRANLALATCLHTSDRAAAVRVLRHLANISQRPKPDSQVMRILAANAELAAILSSPNLQPLDVLRAARIMAALDIYAGALAELSVALRMDGSLADAHALRAQIFSAHLGQHDRALGSLQEALAAMESAPDHLCGSTREEILTAMAGEQSSLGRYEDALATLSKLPDAGPYLFQIAMANHHLGRYAEARKLLRQLLDGGGADQELEEARRLLASPEYKNLR